MAEGRFLSAAHERRVRLPGGPPPLALVTGAGRPAGIGRAICRRLAEAGLDVVGTHSPSEQPDAVASVGIDLADPAAPAALFDALERDRGRPPAVLVNNAAHSTRDGWASLDAATLDAHYAVNVRGSALLATELCRRLPADRAGRIVFLTSGQSKGPMPGELAYAASKGALDALCVSLAAEVAPLGITVNNVNPGPVDTGWMDDEIRATLLANFPMGRAGEPDDPARLVAFLVSDEARWITGQVISSEGGYLRR